MQQLKTKAWADVVESLIGLVYLEAGENAAMEFLVYLGILPEVPCGFVEPAPTAAVVEELSLDDNQLAADIAAAEAAAAGMDLNAHPAASARPDTEMVEAEALSAALPMAKPGAARLGDGNVDVGVTIQAADTLANPAGVQVKAQHMPAQAMSAQANQGGMLGMGMANFTPAMWSGPITAAGLKHQGLAKPKPGMLLFFFTFWWTVACHLVECHLRSWIKV